MSVQRRNIANTILQTRLSSILKRQTRGSRWKALDLDSSVPLNFTGCKVPPKQVFPTGCGDSGVRKGLSPMEHRILQHQAPTVWRLSPHLICCAPLRWMCVTFSPRPLFGGFGKSDTVNLGRIFPRGQ